MRTRLIALPMLSLALLFSLGASAFAAAPPSGPAVIQSVTFETPSDTLQTYTDFGGSSAGPATWGRVTQQHGAGSTYGLWCAGTSAAWGNYPAGTRGLAVLGVPDCSEWDESAIRYSYIEPTAESGANPFVVNWVDATQAPTSSVPPTGYSDPFRPIASTWTTVVIPRGALGDPPLSAGYLRFQFVSNPLAVATGQGVTIDDIAVTGYKFGAVNNLTAARQHGDPSTVVVNWDAPFARGTSTPDSRDIWYRVWRHDMGANTWTEVTSSRIFTDTFTDTGVPLPGTYQYVVQGWDASGETAWGKNATSESVGPGPVVSADSYETHVETTLTVSAPGVLANDVAPSGFSLTAAVASGPSHGTLSLSPDGAFVYVPEVGWSGTDTFTYEAGDGALFSSSATVTINVTPLMPAVDPRFISAMVAPATVKYDGGSTLRAVLLGEVGEPWGGQGASISIQRQLTGGAWTTIAGSVSEIANGTYSAYVRSTVSANYRLYHQATGVSSSPVRVAASAYLTTPYTPSKVKRKRAFTVSGKVSGIPGIARSVTLRLYRKETKRVAGKSTVVWVLRSSVVVRVSGTTGVASYKKAIKVSLKGAYRATATVADVHSAWTRSGYRYFSAR